jgi:DNA-binding transcriptional ArsR family regulator
MKRSPCHLFFETLATELKIDIIERLREGPLSVGELSESLGQERSKVSHALLSLRECGFVEVERKGKQRVYSLNKKTIVPLLNLVEKHIKNHCRICRKKVRK